MYINYIYICILIIHIYNIFTYKQYRKMFSNLHYATIVTTELQYEIIYLTTK